MRINIRGIDYHAERFQDNRELPDLLLLHGFMGSGRAFDHLLEPLGAFCNPVTLDLLGHGRTASVISDFPFSTEEQVEDLRILFQELLSSPFYLHGYSMGGRLALQYAVHHPSSLHGLILESASYGLEDDESRAERRRLDDDRAQSIEADFSGFLQQWKQLPLFNTPARIPVDRMRNYELMQQNQRPDQLAFSLRGFGTGTMPCCKDQLSDLNCPALLIAGALDDKFTRINREMHRLMPDSRLELVEQAGHRVHLEQPEVLVQLLESFITD